MAKRSAGSLAGFEINLDALSALPAEERAQVEAQLLELEEQYKRNPLLRYEPHAKQAEFHVAPFPALRAFFGGNRSGKTTAGGVDTIVQAIPRELVPAHLQAFKRWDPPFFCRVVTPDLTNTLEGVVLETFRQWTPREALKGGSFEKAWDKQLRMLRFKEGSWIQFFSNDQDRDKFGGAALHRTWYDEEPRQDIRQECLTRLIDFDGEEIFTMTPFSGMSWLYDDVYEPWERGKLVDGRVVVVDMDDNPHLSEAGKARALAQYSGEEREARKSGRFVSFGGLIYPEFSWTEHRIPELQVPAWQEGVPGHLQDSAINQEFEVIVGIDPGLRNPGVVFCFLDFNDCLTVFDEILLPDRTIRDVCQEIRKRELKWRITPRWYVIDPASRNRNGQTGRSDQQTFSDHGIHTYPGQNDQMAGINKVKERIQARKLLVSDNCQTLRAEFKRYRWAQSTRSLDDKEKVVKKDDHLLDALRYVVMARPLVPVEHLPVHSMTMKDRLLRAHLKRVRVSKVPDHPSGPGVFA